VNPEELNAQDRFILRQRIKLVINQYEFSLPQADSDEPGTPFCFVEQKRFKFKEDIRFFTDDSKQNELLRIKARQRFDPRARYDVTGVGGEKIGQIQKAFGKSLLRSTYLLYGANDEELATVNEKNLPVAIFRRIVGFIPFIGGFADLMPIAYDFEFRHGEELLGTNTRRRWKFRDVYTIDMSPDAERTVDRRLVLALAVGQDALQAR